MTAIGAKRTLVQKHCSKGLGTFFVVAESVNFSGHPYIPRA